RSGDKLYQAAIVPLAQDQNLVGFLLLAQSVNDALCRDMARVSGAQIAFWLPVGKGMELVASSFDDAGSKALREVLATLPADVLAAVSAGKSVPQANLS